MMKRLSTLGLAVLLAIAPAFSGDSPAQQGLPVGPASVLANSLVTVTDDFIVDVYHNGVKLPDQRRELVEDLHGATVERIKVDVKPGDWLVFNVVSNRIRWGGSSYFAVSGRGASGLTIASEPDSGRWSCCDDLEQVGQFIADRDRFWDHRVMAPPIPWGDGDSVMARVSDGAAAKAIWGGSRNTWIKFIAR